MIKSRIKRIAYIGIVLIGIILIIQPFLFKKSYIGKLTNLEISKTAKIIDYKFGFSVYGIDSFYAKLEIDPCTYESITKNLISDINYLQYIRDEIIPHYDYTSLVFENMEELKFNQLMDSKSFFMFGGTTRIIYYIVTMESIEQYYLYVFY